jgi:ribosome maturation protein SDO1
LKTGELQVSDKEREVHLEGLFKDIVNFIVERCVHPQSGRQHTPLAVDNALRSIGFSVKPEKAAKKQALDGIKALCEKMPESFLRAKMRLRITCPIELASDVKDRLVKDHAAEIEEESKDSDSGVCALTFVCDPSHYRQLDQMATATYKGKGLSVQIVTATVLNESADILNNVQAPRTNETVPVARASNTASTGGYQQTTPQQICPPTGGTTAGATKPKGMKCSTCDTHFEDVSEYRAHCKSEWHNFNLRRKVKGMPPVSEDEFKEISLDAKEGFIACD